MTSSAAPIRIVDRYALFDVIGTGGMAAVHLGRLIGPVGFTRTVAIKRLHENFAHDPEFVAMLLDEARLVARIRHPNVVPTLDIVAAGQELLLVMEYVLGESLGQLIKHSCHAGKFIPIPIVVDILTGVLTGLHAAHEATNEKGEPLNVVHRDVSPQNVIVGADGVTRVLDFGIAQAMGNAQQNTSGLVKGKVRYMPPEQLNGEQVGRAADIYAASVVLWETLAGTRLFGKGTDEEAAQRVLEGKIPRPSEVRPDVPPELDEIVLRGLRRDPNERYPTAKAMAEALESVAPPVTRSTVSNWVLDCAGNEIQRRQDALARVESSLTPASSTPSSAPAGEPNGDSNSLKPLAQSVAPAAPAEAPWYRRKRLVAAVGATALLGIAGVPALFSRSPAPEERPEPALAAPVAAPPVAPATPANSTADLASSEAPAAATPATSASPPPAASAAPASQSKLAPATTGAKRSRARASSFDRIYRRD